MALARPPSTDATTPAAVRWRWPGRRPLAPRRPRSMPAHGAAAPPSSMASKVICNLLIVSEYLLCLIKDFQI
jgi:hypothetical protein